MSTKPMKVVLLGEGRVGKTSIGTKWMSGTFDPGRKKTVQAAFFENKVHTSTGVVNLQVWDTAGQEEFHAIAPIYYKDSQAALLVYSVTDQASFERMVKWRNELQSARGDSVLIICVANKIDMVSQRVVTSQQGQDYAKSINCQHFEVSAKTGEGIDPLFKYLAEQLEARAKKQSGKSSGGKRPMAIQIIDEPEQNQSGCGC